LAIRARATERDVTVDTDCPPNISAPLDADLIRTALDNLLENALRYAPAGSTITLRARRDARQIVIEVADTGPGFPPEFLPHAFERFRRADEGRARSAGGAGVGLSIVQAVAGAHGGDVEAMNRPEGGAAVNLRLPADVRTLTS
jgi:signal transduction histidine kinase